LTGAPDGSFVEVMTHSHALDLQIVEEALGAGRFGYVGLIGSATKRARFEKRMREAGLPGEAIESLVCPIGIAGIRSKRPAAIAAAVAVQLLARDEALRAEEAPAPIRERLGAGAGT
jgi:xanthine dehydrogenase accessory factor